jgi:hypothetical protein
MFERESHAANEDKVPKDLIIVYGYGATQGEWAGRKSE